MNFPPALKHFVSAEFINVKLRH